MWNFVESQKFIRRVRLPQLSNNSNYYGIWKLIFSITLDMLVIRCYNQDKVFSIVYQDQPCTWISIYVHAKLPLES